MEQKTIDIYDLTGVMLDLDSARTILGELMEDHFDLDPQSEKGRSLITYDHPRARAKCHAVSVLLYGIEKELEAMGADTGYRREKQ